MFSRRAEPRRQSYKTFTRGLLNASEIEEAANYRAKHPELVPLPEDEAVDSWSNPTARPRAGPPSSPDPLQIHSRTSSGIPASSSAHTHLSTSTSANSISTASSAHLPSAALILGETSSLQPKLPRSMSGAMPLSYAYGAPSTGKEKPTHTRAPRGSIGGAEDMSLDGRSSRRGGKSRGRAGEEEDDAASESVSMSGVGGPQGSPDPASVRYARLKQRVQNTGSIQLPTGPDPALAASVADSSASAQQQALGASAGSGFIRKNPKPTATASKDTSVNIAVAIQEDIARKRAAAAAATTSSSAPAHFAAPVLDGSYEMDVDLRDHDLSGHEAPLPGHDGENGNAVKETHTVSPVREGDTSNSKKRKKGRKSADPTYKYRPEDAASSDSEAGEGLAGAKGKRDAKVPNRSLPGEGSGIGENRRPKKKARKSGANEREEEDSETGSDVDTGEGIAKSRGRRSLANGHGDVLEEFATAAHSAKPKSKGKKPRRRADGDYGEETGSDEETGEGIALTRFRRSGGGAGNADVSVGDVTANGSTTYYVSGPATSSSLSPISSPKKAAQAQARQDDTFGSGEGVSYSYEEEERMVRALEAEEAAKKVRQAQQQVAPQANVEVRRRVALANAEARRPVPKLPVGRDASVVSDASTAYVQPRRPEGWGYKLGMKARKAVMGVGRFARALRLWHFGVLAVICALLMASPSTFPFSRRPRRAAYVAPSVPPGSVEELVERLSMVERAVGSLSTLSDVEQARLDDTHRVSSELEKRVVELEADSATLSLRITKDIAGIEKATSKDVKELEEATKSIKVHLDRVGATVKDLEVARKSGSADVDKLRKSVDRTTRDVADLGGKLDRVEKDVAKALERDRIGQIALDAVAEWLPPQLAVRIDQTTGRLNIDPTFWTHLKSAFAEKGAAGMSSAGSEVVASVAWDDFLAQNERALQGWLDSDFERRQKAGAAVSRKTFLDVLKRELAALQAEMEKTADDHYHRLGSEIAKQAASASAASSKAGGRFGAPQVGDKPVVIKSSDGRQLNDVLGSLIDAALIRYSKDTLARQDFALYTAGARVIPAMTSETYNLRPSTFIGRMVGFATGSDNVVGRPPVTALHPDTSTGMCWAIQGTHGQLGISLSREIVPTDVTIEHAPLDLAPDVSSAPRDFEVWGFVERSTDLERLEAYRQAHPEEVRDGPTSPYANDMLLATGTYTPSATNFIQTIPVNAATGELGIPIRIVMVKITSNHGNPYTTCLYRVRVHGDMWQETQESTTAE